MAQACPLVFRQVDATVVRIGSSSVMFIVVLFLISMQVGLLYLLSVDFLIRLYGKKSYSPVYLFSVGIKSLLRLETKMEDAGAKRLAAQLGLFFLLVLIAAYHLHLDILLYTAAVVFLSCASMELLFGYCVGCKVYFVIKKITSGF